MSIEYRKMRSEIQIQNMMKYPSRYGRGHGGYVFNEWENKDIYLRSSWEITFAQFCNKVNLEWKYESIRLPYKGFTKIPDFLIEDILYEVGWHPHYETMEAAYNEGWKICLVGQEVIDSMGSFLRG